MNLKTFTNAIAIFIGLGLIVFQFNKNNSQFTQSLEEVLADYRPPSVPFTALYLERRLVSPRIQAFIDFMVQQAAVWTDYEARGSG
jgi:DNA-binding transcriptional LysR family regulator